MRVGRYSPPELQYDDALCPWGARPKAPGAVAGVSLRSSVTSRWTPAARRQGSRRLLAADPAQICGVLLRPHVGGRGPRGPLFDISESSTFGKKCWAPHFLPSVDWYDHVGWKSARPQ